MSSKALVTCAFAAALASAIVQPSAQTLEQLAGGPRRFHSDDPLWQDDDKRAIKPPAAQDLSKSYEFVANTFGDTARSKGPALNVNTLGEVPNSSWFTNRLGRFDMTIDEVLRGPDVVDGPAPGQWAVTGRPDAGITPKFTIRDARGDTYMIKLDPASNPELPSSVELISTKIFHAIGYHVPEDFVVTFDLSRLTVAEGARMRNAGGKRLPIKPADVERWLRSVPRAADGSIRALASRYVPGKVVGQFMYTGQRSDDPNDLFPHERRRELRGLRVFCAWLNHDDARSINSIDTYLEENGRRYIRHYLQDFGSNLGSGSTSAQQPRGGYEYLVDGGKIVKGLAGLGFYERDWMKARWLNEPSIGNIEAEVYDPAKWKTEYPNPAFNQMDSADAFWAGSILARFTDRMIRGIVEEARLSNADAARHLTEVIIKRRDKTVQWAITQTNPIDRFAVRGTATPELMFDNAAVRLGLSMGRPSYRIRWAAFDNRTGAMQPLSDELNAVEPLVVVPPAAWGPPDFDGVRYAIAAIATIAPAFPNWAEPVEVALRDRSGRIDVVGIERLNRAQWQSGHRR